ncbi:MAG: hypothetical protein ACI9Y1_002214 [Lentisphaeria bacterium]|jgi:hypothetical protein
MKNKAQAKQRTLLNIMLGVLVLISTGLSFSNPMEKWESWVLEDHPQYACPWVMAKDNNKACIWPGKLELNAGDEGATFTYTVDVYQKNAFIALPGNVDYWPTALIVNGKPAPIVERNKLPHISISSGHHKVSGKFKWDKRPGQLAIPQNVAIVSLLIEGKSRVVDRRNGLLIFSSKSDVTLKKADDSLTLEVFRLLNDGVPITMITDVGLSVSGKAREVTFGSVMLAGTEVLHIQSSIPARIESDGSMRAQVSPGEHTIRVHSRFVGSPSTITTKKLTKEWPQSEYISFKSATAIRQANLSGPVSIDTSQVSIPSEWAEYPTFRMSDGETLILETEFRGDHSPAANTLYVTRDLWLDFNGEGITALDRISGEMNKGWRLNAAKGTNIGRATVDEEPVLITRDENLEGIEVRSPNIELKAVTRIESRSDFSASGWNARADQFSATLHLPPGWRVLHAKGIDRVWGTWLSKWDLWDVFLVLIIISATRKLIGNRVAALAGTTFLIALHEPGNPLLIIPLLLIVIALLPLVSGKIKSILRSVGVLLGVALALSVISFAVSTFRLAIYPSLELTAIGTYNQNSYNSSYSRAASAPAEQMGDDFEASESKVRTMSRAKEVRSEEVLVTGIRKQNLYQVTENDRVQTGPGLPTWTWSSVSFESSSPVPANQSLSIYYSSPLVTSIWRVLSVFLIALYAGVVLKRLASLSRFKGAGRSGLGGAAGGTAPAAAIVLATCFVFLIGLSHSPNALSDDYPPEHLLDSLEKRLTKAPDCLPACFSLNDGQITVNGTDIRLQFSAYMAADIALPLPRSHGTWALVSVSENGQLLPLRKQQGSLFVRLPKGHHMLVLKGKIIADQATISFPFAIHNMAVSAPGWELEGLVEGRVRNGTLTLRAIDENATQKVDTLKADSAPTFVHVKRHFVFGKKWNIETTVQRISPLKGAISLPIKLIAHEKLMQDMGAVKNGEIVVQLGHSQQHISWQSSIEPSEQLQLTASDGDTYIEQWSFSPSSLWRIKYEGIPPVKADGFVNAFEPVFKPWPAETLIVYVSKPSGVPGETHTVESAVLKVEAGNTLQRSTLTLDIRSSLGTSYTATLPSDAEVLRYSIDGRAMNIPSGREVKIPLQPGSQSVVVEFQSLTSIGMINRSPEVLLPSGATNVRLQYTLPRDRWPLYLSGPPIGPAMLYWGVLCVIVLAALALPMLAKALNFKMPIAITGWILLGVGLSTVNGYGVLVVAVMFFILAARKQLVVPEAMSRFNFNLMQCSIVAWVGLAVLCVVTAIPMGLLSNPEMKVVGNGSGSHFYNYYQDIVGEAEAFPTVMVISVPMLAYRAVMLLWSLWLSTRLILWASWAWACFIEKASWMPKAVIGKEKES